MARPISTAALAKIRDHANTMKYLSDANRLTICVLLRGNTDGMNVTELTERIGISQPAASHHLALLRHAGILAANRVGKNVIYTLEDETIANALPSIPELNGQAALAGKR